MVALRNNPHPLDEIAGESVKAISLWQPYDTFFKHTVQRQDEHGKPVTRIITHAMRDWFERNPPKKDEIPRWEASIAKFEAEITKLTWDAAELRKKWAADEDEREAIKYEGMALMDEVRRTEAWISAYQDRLRICREVGT